MKTYRNALNLFVVVFATLGLTACGGGDDDDPEGPKTGTMSMDMTDATADNVSQVRLSISAVAVKPQEGARVQINYEDEPLVIENLLELQGANAAEIMGDTEVPAGRYNWVRLYINGGDPDSYVMTDQGERFDLYVPGQQPGSGDKKRHVQLVSGFTVPAGGNVDYTLDVDLRRALTKPANSDYYLLRPALRIVDNSRVGTIQGTVADSLVNDESCTNDLNADEGNAVYLYEGHDASTGDVYLDEKGEPVTEDNPLTVANVTQNPDTGEYEYEIGFVLTGDYTLAFTCQALDDDEASDDTIAFADNANITLEAGETETQDFPTATVTATGSGSVETSTQ